MVRQNMPRGLTAIALVFICVIAATDANTQAQVQEATVSDTYEAGIAPARIKTKWPDGREMPKLIGDIADLVRPWPWGSVGYFSMMGSRFNDYWVEGGADLSEQFGMFLKLPDGTELALWYHDDAVAGAEPVVLIGSEGQLQVLAPTLKQFVALWADGNGPLDLARSEEFDDPAEKSAYLAAWDVYADKLRALAAAVPDPPTPAPVPDLKVFVDTFAEKSRKEIAADPLLREIAKLLDAHVPRGKEVWERTLFRITVAGPRIEILSSFLPPDYKSMRPLPEREALVALILKAREERARKTPARGLWHDAALWLHPDGHAEIAADWSIAPKFKDGTMATKAELDADLARFPRSPRWREPWMDELK
jgi:hypothetical protein